MLSVALTAIDFETTGQVKNQQNYPWQIGLARLTAETLDLEKAVGSFLHVPQEAKFNPYTPGRWAERREELRNAPRLTECWQKYAKWLNGSVLVAHHAATERTVLQEQFPFHDFSSGWIDTLVLARLAYPGLESYSLSNLLRLLRLEEEVQSACPGLAAHDAVYDAVGCGMLLRHILRQPGWRDLSVVQLQQFSSVTMRG